MCDYCEVNTHPGEEPSRWAGRGCPGNHSADIVIRVPLPQGVKPGAQEPKSLDLDKGKDREGTKLVQPTADVAIFTSSSPREENVQLWLEGLSMALNQFGST